MTAASDTTHFGFETVKLAEKQAREAELKAIEQRLAGNREAREKLEGEIAAIRADRAALNKALLDTTARTQAGEQKLGELEKRLALLQSSEAAIRRSLDSRRSLIAEVLAALQRIGRRPPPAVLVRPEDILDAVRASMLLGAVVPDLRQEVEILGTDLAELVRLRNGIAGEKTNIGAEMEQLAAERQRLASLVEVVEAFTIVLAVGTVRGWRPALLGTGSALSVLAVLVLLLGSALTQVPLQALQLVIGVLLMLFGLRWLRKAILRSAGFIALHDEDQAFAKETGALRGSGGGTARHRD